MQKSIPTTSHLVNDSNCRTQLLVEESRVRRPPSCCECEATQVTSPSMAHDLVSEGHVGSWWGGAPRARACPRRSAAPLCARSTQPPNVDSRVNLWREYSNTLLEERDSANG